MMLSDDGKLYLVDFGSVKIQNKEMHNEFLSNQKVEIGPENNQ